MSAAEYPSFLVRSSTGPALLWRARSARRLETLALALGICLPVPVFAALGLSLPLPNVVERIAAALVPWADSVTLEAGELPQGASGSIVPAAADARPSRASAATPSVTQRFGPALRTATPLVATPPSRPGATAPAPTSRPGGIDRPGTVVPPAEGNAPARQPEAQPKPGSGPAGVTEQEPAPTPVPVVPPTPVPSAAPIPSVPVPLPVPVQEAVDDVVAVAAEPVETVVTVVTAPLPLGK